MTRRVCDRGGGFPSRQGPVDAMEEESGMLPAPGCDHRRDAWPVKLLQVVGGGRRAIRTVDDFILDLFLFFSRL